MIGAAMRMWQTTVISFYCITYFNYYEKQAQFGILNAFLILFGGFSSSIICGRICDRLETQNKNYRIKSLLPALSSVIAVPLFMLVFLLHFNFYFSIAMLFLEYLLCEGWMAPVIAMVQTVIEVKYKAVSVGVFFFATSLA